MNELITVTVNERDEQVVSGRNLHEYLAVETPYRIWFPRMCEYGFSEGADYTPYIFVHPQNKQETTDHALKINMAKELCMLARSEKGKQARQYFIRIQEAWNDPNMIMARALRIADRKTKAQEALIAEQQAYIKLSAPKVAFAEKVTDSKDTVDIGELAKLAMDENIRIGRNRLFAWLREKGIIMSNCTTPYQPYMDKGWFKLVECPRGDRVFVKTVVTGKGQIGIVKKLKKERSENIED